MAGLLQEAQERLKNGDNREALRLFLILHDQAKMSLSTVECVKNAYTKLSSDPGMEQGMREEILIRLQRINSLRPQYGRYRWEAAYHIGLLSAKQGDKEQARKYLLEVCQSAPPSLEPSSLWMKSKVLLLETLGLQGEF